MTDMEKLTRSLWLNYRTVRAYQDAGRDISEIDWAVEMIQWLTKPELAPKVIRTTAEGMLGALMRFEIDRLSVNAGPEHAA